MRHKLRLPGPAMVVALVALFVALSGTESRPACPPSPSGLLLPTTRRSWVVRHPHSCCRKQRPQRPPRRSSRGRQLRGESRIVKSAPFTVGPGGETVVTAACDAGSKATGGGFINPTSALVLSAGATTTADGSGWTEDLVNISDSTPGAGNVVVVCMK